MGDVLNFLAPFFITPTTYSQVLQRLAGAAFWEVFAMSFFLRDIPAIGKAFGNFETSGSLGAFIGSFSNSASLNISGFLIAVTVAGVSYVIQLHDRISDALGIRRRFECDRILFPLAELCGVSLSDAKRKAARKLREWLMREVFYRYASSRSEQPLVDKHDIEHALSAWSWLWIALEGVVYLCGASALAFIFGDSSLGRVFAIVAAVTCILAVLQHGRLKGYTRAEIHTIAADATAASHIRATFNAI